jgi:hypothetical protein
MGMRIVSAAIVASVIGATTLAQAQTQSQTRTHKRAAHVAAVKHDSNRVIVTRRSYLDPGPEPLLSEEQASTGYIFPLGMLNYHPGTKNPTDPTGSRFWPVNDPFFPRWP